MRIEELLAVVESSPLPWVHERDIDLVIAESLGTCAGFAAWLLNRIDAVAWPASAVLSCEAAVHFNRPGASSEATGETDVLAVLTWVSGERGLLSVENKALGSPRLGQARRHRRFLEDSGVALHASVLVAPAAWITDHPAEAAAYHGWATLEDVAAWHQEHTDPSAHWRARVLDQACRQRHGGQAMQDVDR